jgi:hypothetical protein
VNAWKVILATLVIFIAGVMTGGLLVRNAMRFEQLVSSDVSSKQSPRQNKPTNGPGGGNVGFIALNNPWAIRNRELLRRMDRELDLTPEQHKSVEALMQASEERTRVLWKPIAPQMNKEAQLVRNEIRTILMPDQQKVFDGFKNRQPLRRNVPTNAPSGDNMFNALPAPTNAETNGTAN